MSRAERIKAWRAAEFAAGRPSDLADYYAAYPQDKRAQERDEAASRKRIRQRLRSSWLYS